MNTRSVRSRPHCPAALLIAIWVAVLFAPAPAGADQFSILSASSDEGVMELAEGFGLEGAASTETAEDDTGPNLPLVFAIGAAAGVGIAVWRKRSRSRRS